MNPLEPSDIFHLRAAEGWLELGNPSEANEELENIDAALRSHPDVLEVRWQVYAKSHKWEACIDIANALITLAPSIPLGWIHRSFALHELKRTQEAYELLRPAMESFPDDCVVRYNLACYACRLGNVAEARKLLDEAIERGDAKAVKLSALDDPDLDALWRSSKS